MSFREWTNGLCIALVALSSATSCTGESDDTVGSALQQLSGDGDSDGAGDGAEVEAAAEEPLGVNGRYSEPVHPPGHVGPISDHDELTPEEQAAVLAANRLCLERNPPGQDPALRGFPGVTRGVTPDVTPSILTPTPAGEMP